MAGVWTNNWRGVKNLMLIGADVHGLSTIINTSGAEVDASPKNDRTYYYLSPIGAYSANSMTCVRFGTGENVSPSPSDYRLEQTASGLSYLSASNGAATVDLLNGTISRVITVTVQNTNPEPITLTEWGITGYVIYAMASSTSSSTVGSAVLIYHATLSSPVTLQQYEAATFDLTLTMALDDPI